MNLLEIIRRAIRQNTVNVGQPVTNIHGASASFVKGVANLQDVTWLRLTIPGAELVSLGDFYSIYGGDATHPFKLLEGIVGVTTYTEPQNLIQLYRGVIVVEYATQLVLSVELAGAASKAALYVDGVLDRSDTESLATTRLLEPGSHMVELMVVSSTVKIRVSDTVKVDGTADLLLQPVWAGISTGYADTAGATTTVTLQWNNDARSGGWRLFRRQSTSLAGITTVSDSASRRYSLTITGDFEAALPAGNELFANDSSIGTVIQAAYNTTAGSTSVTLQLPTRLLESSQNWVGKVATTGLTVELTRIRRTSSGGLVTYVDNTVALLQGYYYTLQAYSLFDDTVVSPFSETRYVVAGDQTPPSSITFLSGYPYVLGGIVRVRFRTPTDLDYAGVGVVYRQTMTGTVSSYSGTTMGVTVSGLTTSAVVGWKVYPTSGNATRAERTVTANTATSLTLDAPYESINAPASPNTILLYLDKRMVTDYGVPDTDDELQFTPPTYGTFQFRAFDLAGNEQQDAQSLSWTYTSGDDHSYPAGSIPNLQVTSTPGSTSYSIAWAGDSVQVSLSGGAYATPGANPYIVTRPTAGATDATATFRATLNSIQYVTDTVTIPAVSSGDTNTVTPDLTVTPGTQTTTTQPFTVTATNPAGGTAPVITVTLNGTTGSGNGAIGAISDGVPVTAPSGAIITVNRPAFSTVPASMTVRAAISGGGAETIQRTILNQDKTGFGPNLTVTPTPGNPNYSIAWSGDSVTLDIDGGGYATPGTSPIAVVRNGAGGADKLYTFKAVKDSQTVTNSVTIPAIGASDTNTVTPNLDVTASAPATTTQTYTITLLSNPSGGTAPTCTVSWIGVGLVTKNGGGSLTSPQASVQGDVWLVTRPVASATGAALAGSIKFSATITSNGSEVITFPVVPIIQDTILPTLILTAAENGTTGNVTATLVDPQSRVTGSGAGIIFTKISGRAAAVVGSLLGPGAVWSSATSPGDVTLVPNSPSFIEVDCYGIDATGVAGQRLDHKRQGFGLGNVPIPPEIGYNVDDLGNLTVTLTVDNDTKTVKAGASKQSAAAAVTALNALSPVAVITGSSSATMGALLPRAGGSNPETALNTGERYWIAAAAYNLLGIASDLSALTDVYVVGSALSTPQVTYISTIPTASNITFRVKPNRHCAEFEVYIKEYTTDPGADSSIDGAYPVPFDAIVVGPDATRYRAQPETNYDLTIPIAGGTNYIMLTIVPYDTLARQGPRLNKKGQGNGTAAPLPPTDRASVSVTQTTVTNSITPPSPKPDRVRVYRDNALISTQDISSSVSGTPFTLPADTGLAPSTTYSYTYSGYDSASGAESAGRTNPLLVTTSAPSGGSGKIPQPLLTIANTVYSDGYETWYFNVTPGSGSPAGVTWTIYRFTAATPLTSFVARVSGTSTALNDPDPMTASNTNFYFYAVGTLTGWTASDRSNPTTLGSEAATGPIVRIGASEPSTAPTSPTLAALSGHNMRATWTNTQTTYQIYIEWQVLNTGMGVWESWTDDYVPDVWTAGSTSSTTRDHSVGFTAGQIIRYRARYVTLSFRPGPWSDFSASQVASA